MNDILFIRHAETDMAGTFCGHSNPPINARGQHQIQTLINTLHGEEIECIFTSDLARAAYTARALADAFRVPCIEKPSLREIDFGNWEGLTWQQIQQRDEAYARRWTATYPNLPAPGGESFADFRARVIAEVTAISNDANLRHAAVVTHGGVMRIVLQTICGLGENEASELTKPYCSFFQYPFEVTR